MNDAMNHHDTKRSIKDAVSSFRGLMSEMSAFTDAFTDALAEHEYQCGFLPVVTLKDCIRYYKEASTKLQGADVSGFILSIKKNPDPRNENDNFVVVQGLLDRHNKPITINGGSVSRIMHTRTLDDALIKALNGKESIIFRG